MQNCPGVAKISRFVYEFRDHKRCIFWKFNFMLQSFHFLFSPLGNFLFSPYGIFLFSPLDLHLLPNLLLHGDTIVSMSVPVCSLASSATVARLQKRLFFPNAMRTEGCVTFLHPAHLLFFNLDTSAWQNQQIRSALSLTLPPLQALASALCCLALLPSFRIFLTFFFCTAFGQSLR